MIEIGVDYALTSKEIIERTYVYSLMYKLLPIGEFKLKTIGDFNVTNSIFAIATAMQYGISVDIIKEALLSFCGVERRYEQIKEIAGVPIIIDYAHHPTEIQNSITSLKSVYSNPLIIFQPHTYSRTIKLFKEFINVFNNVEGVVIHETYPAREKEIDGGRAIDLFDSLNLSNKTYSNDVYWLMEYINDKISNKQCDSVLVLGAGDLAVKLKKLLM